jgi:hypothetical protein
MVPNLPIRHPAGWPLASHLSTADPIHLHGDRDTIVVIGFWRERFRIAAYNSTRFLSDLGKLQDG